MHGYHLKKYTHILVDILDASSLPVSGLKAGDRLELSDQEYLAMPPQAVPILRRRLTSIHNTHRSMVPTFLVTLT
jgi:hypothetical protein